MNKAKLTALYHKISKNTGLTFNSVMTYYFLEVIMIIELLERFKSDPIQNK